LAGKLVAMVGCGAITGGGSLCASADEASIARMATDASGPAAAIRSPGNLDPVVQRINSKP
jgi:hypothetical protein